MSSEKATVSVIIPVYNSAPWLSECLNSVCSQTLKGTEIICVNDGSTDNSLEILEAYQRQDNRIRIIRQKNSGLSMTRNAGIQVATGKYLYFLDSDDYIDTNALEILAKRMDEDDLQLVFFNTVAFGDDIDNIEFAKEKNANYYHRELDEEAILPGPELFQQLNNKNNFLCNAGVSMIRSDLILDKGLSFHPGALHEDEAWTFSALIFASRCGCVNKNFPSQTVQRMLHNEKRHLFCECIWSFLCCY